ncbi:CLUMA_CG017726, isoform A [Clunio marinus]|uniref:CLUMA_CG017726, isoform A n=1 Tax=Clunio marinus TaxID=568069 RepID=A0A1J1IZR0_9DIPT|nr:CLUMA_CG017726, isoform A [Clunio marinus]
MKKVTNFSDCPCERYNNTLDKAMKRIKTIHEKYLFIKNIITAEKTPDYQTTITYTTHGDVVFLIENIIPLLERWQAPISIALYTPGSDFNVTLDAILYFRNCHDQRDLVRDFASFHFFLEKDLVPKDMNLKVDESKFSCSSNDHLLNLKHEAYPDGKSVFVLPVFEIEKGVELPQNKSQLRKLFKDHKLFLFHEKVCRRCHKVPNQTQWMEEDDPELKVFVSVKRKGEQEIWEPFYVGTNAEPIFDERLSWEGQFNKMIQAYTMCLLDYNYHVLSNAFLIHRPGIKTKKQATRVKWEAVGRKTIQELIRPDLKLLYGERKGCWIVGMDKSNR